MTVPVSYDRLAEELSRFIPAERLIRDPLRTLAYGTDASFYRLVPKIVVKVDNEQEVCRVLAACRYHRAPVTFRAAGTSLSGQAVTDSVLMVLTDRWDGVTISDQGQLIRLQPGVIGAEANRRLASYARKIGPDPASIDSAKIGGMAANNSSGMCCGTSDNSYQTLSSLRMVLADGAVLDTASEDSRAAFRLSHSSLLLALETMGATTRGNAVLAERIRRKFSIKNTTGYSLNALVDFTDPIDILQHLLIGSEGTLGFISEITYRTVSDPAHKASALALFPDIGEACRAVAVLKEAPVSAVELMDCPALRSVAGKPGMPEELTRLAEGVTALLIETRAEEAASLHDKIAQIEAVLAQMTLFAPTQFTSDPADYGTLWKIRKGLFPAVGAVRKTGTTVIIEDVAFQIADLAQATLDLQALLRKHQYHEAIIFGHALDGNLHFVFTQDFSTDAEVLRYAALMEDVCDLVVNRYDGSLKAEHGTGRNMAPFVEQEWGADAYHLMRQIKELLDPEGLLNPGVILDDDPQAHLHHLKPLPPADPLVDTCIECGFCERMCPSHGWTLSPRQRIVGWREISRATAAHEDPLKIKALREQYDWNGIDTCAACGLCSLACPVGIETGLLTKALRGRRLPDWQQSLGQWTGDHFAGSLSAGRLGLRAASLVGTTVSRAIGKVCGVGATLPRPAPARPAGGSQDSRLRPVVYVPSCANRLFGNHPTSLPQDAALPDVFITVMNRAGYRALLPASLEKLCCGQSYETKGMNAVADQKALEFANAILESSDQGRLPVVMDASACSFRLKRVLPSSVTVLDSIEFAHDSLLPNLKLTPRSDGLLVHVNCSARRMGLEDKMVALARACATSVVVPSAVGCCGFAGDKGFTTPELNDHALRHLPSGQAAGCSRGVSSNKTCEIGLSDHAQVPYHSIIAELEACSR